MATFTGYGKVRAELTNGMHVECETALIAAGDYREWYEPAPCEWMYGWTESEYEIDESSIEARYPDEFEIIFNDTKVIVGDDVKIKRIEKVVDDIDWEVDEDWNEPDGDSDYDAWKYEQIA